MRIRSPATLGSAVRCPLTLQVPLSALLTLRIRPDLDLNFDLLITNIKPSLSQRLLEHLGIHHLRNIVDDTPLHVPASVIVRLYLADKLDHHLPVADVFYDHARRGACVIALRVACLLQDRLERTAQQ